MTATIGTSFLFGLCLAKVARPTELPYVKCAPDSISSASEAVALGDVVIGCTYDKNG